MGEKNFDIYDLFLLELIHYCMPELYNIFRNTPDELLTVDYDSETNVAKYVLRDSEELKEYCLKIAGIQINRYEMQLVLRCFEPRYSNRINRLVVVDTYPNYFCLGIPTIHIDKNEFQNALADRSLIKKKVHDWFWKRPYKSNSSLYTRLMTVRMKELTIDTWKNHIDMLISWMCEGDYPLTKNALLKYLLISNLKIENETDVEYMKQYVYDRIDKALKGKNIQYKNVAKGLSGLYQQITEHENDSLISQKKLIKLLELNFDSFVSKKTTGQWDAINVIAINGNELNALVKSNCIISKEDVFGGSKTVGENLIIPHVISYFSNYKEKSSHIREAQHLYDYKKSRYKNADITNNIKLEDEKKLIFGSKGNYYSQFIRECFVDFGNKESGAEEK